MINYSPLENQVQRYATQRDVLIAQTIAVPTTPLEKIFLGLQARKETLPQESLPSTGIGYAVEKIYSALEKTADYVLSFPARGYQSLVMFSKRGRTRQLEKKNKARAQKKAAKTQQMTNPGGSSKYARKAENGNAQFWEKNPHTKLKEPEPKWENPWFGNRRSRY